MYSVYRQKKKYLFNLSNSTFFTFTGHFATSTLQVPVEGAHVGGRLNVEYKGKSKMFENDHQSGEHFYISTTCNSCCHEVMEPISSGWRLSLVFHLNWINTKTEAPQDFPVFLTAFNEIQEALSPWIPNRRSFENVAEEHLTEKTTTETENTVIN